MNENIILVDENDNQIGTMEKMEAHKKAIRHRAFSILIFNKDGKTMLQQRALTKYHSGGLWTNTCCSHPRVDELTINAAHRRLVEEMGFDCKLDEIYSFKYEIKLDHDLTEKEFDHVFIGEFNGIPNINKDEVMNWAWINLGVLKNELQDKPEKYTFGFREIAKEYFKRKIK